MNYQSMLYIELYEYYLSQGRYISFDKFVYYFERWLIRINYNFNDLLSRYTKSYVENAEFEIIE